MDIKKFWQRASDIYDLYHGKATHAILTDEEQRANAGDFLSDIDSLASEWFTNREENNGNSKTSNKISI